MFSIPCASASEFSFVLDPPPRGAGGSPGRGTPKGFLGPLPEVAFWFFLAFFFLQREVPKFSPPKSGTLNHGPGKIWTRVGMGTPSPLLKKNPGTGNRPKFGHFLSDLWRLEVGFHLRRVLGHSPAYKFGPNLV